MSGGVDSSVAAALLKKQGYFVVGAYMKNFSPEAWEGVIKNACPWQKDIKLLKQVCAKLKIPFRSFNFEKEYRKKVIDYFFNEYQKGRTPNPDIMCNKKIKFGLFLEKALRLGFDYIATGHYARKREIIAQNSKIKTHELLKGTDPKKDQSYFLYSLTQNQLARALFPIGSYAKSEVRKLARKFGLPNWDRKDSQGICFVGHIKLQKFLKQRIPEKPGKIVNLKNQVLGTHKGAWYYTIGQRHGLGVGGGTPYYVTQKNVHKNILVVCPRAYAGLVHHTHAYLNKIHWITKPPKLPFACRAKIRYQQNDQNCTVKKYSGGLKITFVKPQFAIAPGQSIVFYAGDRVLGGGIISSS